MVFVRRRSPPATNTMHQVFNCARPLYEKILSPGSVLYGKAERNPSNVNSDWYADDRIAYVISTVNGRTISCQYAYLLAQPAAVLAPFDHRAGAHHIRSFDCLLLHM